MEYFVSQGQAMGAAAEQGPDQISAEVDQVCSASLSALTSCLVVHLKLSVCGPKAHLSVCVCVCVLSVSVCVCVCVCVCVLLSVMLAGYSMEWVSLSHSDSREGPQAWLLVAPHLDMCAW